MSAVPEKGAVKEGHCNVLRLLFQLCPAAAPESPPVPRRVCDFEGLFASVDRLSAAEGAPTLFHYVAELRAEHRQCFRAAAETGKLPSSALSSRLRLLFGPFACGCNTRQHRDSPACWFVVQQALVVIFF